MLSVNHSWGAVPNWRTEYLLYLLIFLIFFFLQRILLWSVLSLSALESLFTNLYFICFAASRGWYKSICQTSSKNNSICSIIGHVTKGVNELAAHMELTPSPIDSFPESRQSWTDTANENISLMKPNHCPGNCTFWSNQFAALVTSPSNSAVFLK